MANEKTTTLKDIGENVDILNDGVIENTDESGSDIRVNTISSPQPSPVITKAKSYVDTKKPLESKMPPAEKIEIYKRNDNGELELCDVEITREMLSSMSLQDIIRKFLIKKYGYGEYVPMTIKAGKDPIIGGSIKFAKPMDDDDIKQPISNNSDSISTVISQMKDIFETVMNRTEQVRRESEEKYDRITNMIKQQQETISNLLFAKKEGEDTNKSNNDLTALIGLIMQQNQANMNIMIEMMRNNNKPQESFNLSEALEKAMKPIIEKIESIESKNSGLEDLTHTDDDKVKRLEEQINSLKEQLIANERRELENKIDELNKKIMELSNKPTSNNALGSIEEIINVYDKLKEFSSKMFAGNSNGGSSGKEEFMGFLSDIMEKLPDVIDSLKNVSANSNDATIAKAREEMSKLYKQNIELKKYIMKMKKEQNKLPERTKKSNTEPEEGTGKIIVGSAKEQAKQPEQSEQVPNANNTNKETNTPAPAPTPAPEPKKRGRKKKVVNNIVENAIYSKFNNEQFINAVNTENYETALQYILSVIQSNMGVIDTYMSNSGIQTNSNQEKFIAIINFAKPIVEKIEGIDKNKLNNLFEVINKTTKES